MEQVRPPSRFDVKQYVRKTGVCVCVLLILLGLSCGMWMLPEDYIHSDLVSGNAKYTTSSSQMSNAVRDHDTPNTRCLDELSGNDSGTSCFKKKQLRLATVSFLLENISSNQKRTKHHGPTDKMSSRNKLNQAERNLHQPSDSQMTSHKARSMIKARKQIRRNLHHPSHSQMTWHKLRKGIQSGINRFVPDSQRDMNKIINKVADEIVDGMWESPKLMDHWLKNNQPSNSDAVQNHPSNAYMIENQPWNAEPYWLANSALTNNYYRISGCQLRSVNMTVPGTLSQCLKRCLVTNCPTLAVKYNSNMCAISLSYSYTKTPMSNFVCYQRIDVAGYQIQSMSGKTCKPSSQTYHLRYQSAHVCAGQCMSFGQKCLYFMYIIRQDGLMDCMFFSRCISVWLESKHASVTTTLYKKR